MKISLQRFILILALSLLSSSSFADGKAALDLFKSLKGAWTIQENGKPLPIKMNYDLGSRDTVVMEQFGKELSVFYVDKNELLITHFCNRGNQPRLRLAKGKISNTYEFEMIDVTNLESQDDSHVQKIIYRVLDQMHIDLELVWKIGRQFKFEKYALIKE
jgi:hypothetical protein